MLKRYLPVILLLTMTALIVGLRSFDSEGLKAPQPRPMQEPDRPRISRLHNATLLVDGAESGTIVRGQTHVLSGEFDLENAEMEVPIPMMVKLIMMNAEDRPVTCGNTWVSATRVSDRHCTFRGELTMSAAAHGEGELHLIYHERDDPDDSKRIVLRTPVMMEDPGRSAE